MALLYADDVSLKLELLEIKRMMVIASSQLQTRDSAKSDARLLLHIFYTEATAIAAFNQESLRVLKWNISLSGHPSEALQISLNKKLKVMFISYWDVPGFDPFTIFIAVDEENRLRIIKINLLLTPKIDANTVSSPLNYLLFSKNLPRGAASPNLWDYWLFGASDTMTLSDQPLVISSSVGFIMSTHKNRLSPLWEIDLDDLTVVVDNQYQAVDDTQTRLSSQDLAVITSFDFFPIFELKNQWVYKQKVSCYPKVGIPYIDSTCFYYRIYDDPAARKLDLQTLSKNVPRKSSTCDQTQVFQYNRYQNLPLGKKTIRHACYPLQYEYLSDVAPP